MHIYINPGHDNKRPNGVLPVDSGATNVLHGVFECDVVAKIGERVRDLLYRSGYIVTLKQDDHLTDICIEANNHRADLFVSIHCNACDCNAHGTECWYYTGSTNGRQLASEINHSIVKSFPQLTDRGIKEDNVKYGVLNLTNMPAVIVETAFIDNESDYKLLAEYGDLFAEAIAKGITNYCIAKGGV